MRFSSALDVLAADLLQDQRLVERGDDLEVEAVSRALLTTALSRKKMKRLARPCGSLGRSARALLVINRSTVCMIGDHVRGALAGDRRRTRAGRSTSMSAGLWSRGRRRTCGVSVHAPCPDSRLMYDQAGVDRDTGARLIRIDVEVEPGRSRRSMRHSTRRFTASQPIAPSRRASPTAPSSSSSRKVSSRRSTWTSLELACLAHASFEQPPQRQEGARAGPSPPMARPGRGRRSSARARAGNAAGRRPGPRLS